MSSTTEQQHAVAPLTQPYDGEQKPGVAVFRSVPQNWQLTPQQWAFIDAFADDEPQK